MRARKLRFSNYVLAVAMFVPLACSRQGEVAEEAVAAAAEQIWQQFSSTLKSGDLDGWVALWTDDAVRMAPGSAALVGKEQIRAQMSALLDQVVVNMSRINEELRVAGDWAYARGTYAGTLTPKQGGQVIPLDGKYMIILQRQVDGSWKIHRDIFNSSVPPQEN